MNIKLIGADTSNGMKILKNINKAFKELKINFNINKISIKEKEKYGIKNTPTLIIEEKILSSGYVPSDREIKNYIKTKLEA